MPDFFVPMVDADKQEDAYKEMAQFAGAAPASAGNRIYSIRWMRGDETWTATVGEELRGVASVVKGRGRDKRYFEVPRGTSDTVLAIYAGAPFLIMHDNKSRIWNVPILAGEPSQITYFTS